MTKSELRELIRECLREELHRYNLKEGAFSGGVAGDNSINGGTIRGLGASTQPSKKNYLDRLKNKNPDLVDTMTIKGKDIKPGMITQAGQVKEARVEYSGYYKKDMVYIMHTNNYDGFWNVDEDMLVMVDPDNKSKPFTGSFQDLLKKGLKESTKATKKAVNEGIFDKFKKDKPATTSAAEPKKEEPKKEEDAFPTYTYDEWIQALEYGHKYYAEDGPEAGRTKLWNKAMEIAASKNLCKDVTDCMDAWMKQKGTKNFPHKTYAKHLEEDLYIESLFSGLLDLF